jgi:hypothetical protein
MLLLELRQKKCYILINSLSLIHILCNKISYLFITANLASELMVTIKNSNKTEETNAIRDTDDTKYNDISTWIFG